MVDRINGGVNHGRRFCVRPGHQHQGVVQHVSLHADRDQSRDVLCSRYQHLATHVTTLLRSWLLVFDVDAGSTVLDEHLGELHGSCEATVTGIRISDDGVEVVHRRVLCQLLRRHVLPVCELLAVMEELRSEQLVHLVGHGVVGIVTHIWSRLIGGGGSRARLPPTHVHSFKVLRHLNHLHCVQGAKGVRACALGLEFPKHLVELLRDLRAIVVQRE
mmetsp:Transcript_39897/g.93960  ORF Transcript_39897/g.93960 Transcript_39897/m.93960 type:complete len:217 (-) Transcript_39897:323-973(-)